MIDEEETPKAEQQTVEVWAERLGYLPPMIPQGTRFAKSPPPLVPNPKTGEFAAARAFRNASADPAKRWPIGRLTTQAEFEAAIAEAMGQTHG